MRIANDRGNLAYPLSELQAAVLSPQIAKLGERNLTRLANVRRLLEQSAGFAELTSLTLTSDDFNSAAFYKLPFLLTDSTGGGANVSREVWIARLQPAGVAIDAGFRGFVKRSAARCRQVGELANARRAAQSTLLLHHPVLLEPAATIDELSLNLARTCELLTAGNG
jgi:dTDP-4-amino-4,6-dideoxygalactose transaminase